MNIIGILSGAYRGLVSAPLGSRKALPIRSVLNIWPMECMVLVKCVKICLKVRAKAFLEGGRAICVHMIYGEEPEQKSTRENEFILHINVVCNI